MKLLILLLASISVCLAETIKGKVVSVADGDTITVLDETNAQHKIRLFGIDAPEKRQDFGQASKKAMSDMVYSKTVTVDVQDKDMYGREVSKVYVGETYVNLEMVKRGLAWWYYQYAKKAVDLKEAEEKARANKLGLWSRSDSIPPWEFRRTLNELESVRQEQHQEQYWITSSSRKIHNRSCRWYQKSKGFLTPKPQGVNCKACGGKR